MYLNCPLTTFMMWVFPTFICPFPLLGTLIIIIIIWKFFGKKAWWWENFEREFFPFELSEKHIFVSLIQKTYSLVKSKFSWASPSLYGGGALLFVFVSSFFLPHNALYPCKPFVGIVKKTRLYDMKTIVTIYGLPLANLFV